MTPEQILLRKLAINKELEELRAQSSRDASMFLLGSGTVIAIVLVIYTIVQ